MVILGGQTEPGPGPFLLIWSLLAIVGGGVLATKKGAGGARSLVVQGLENSPRQKAQAKTVPAGFLRFLGVLFLLGGAIALIASVLMLLRS